MLFSLPAADEKKHFSVPYMLQPKCCHPWQSVSQWWQGEYRWTESHHEAHLKTKPQETTGLHNDVKRGRIVVYFCAWLLQQTSTRTHLSHYLFSWKRSWETRGNARWHELSTGHSISFSLLESLVLAENTNAKNFKNLFSLKASESGIGQLKQPKTFEHKIATYPGEKKNKNSIHDLLLSFN